MIIDKLKIVDFGVYEGEQQFDLTPPNPNQPVVLVGGLNGGGKTTFLDAIQLCLYGKFASCSNQEGLSYQEYLTRSINRNAEPKRSSVELQFRHVTDGVEHTFRVTRSWQVNGRSTAESFSVERNGQEEEFLAENWTQFVEGILPRKIANLFLFDGEKIEAFASPENSAALLSTATHTLLGMDIVAQLERDLQALKSRKSGRQIDSQTQAEVEAAEGEYHKLLKERQNALQRRAQLKNTETTTQKRYEAIELEFSQKGGLVFERQTEIEQELEATSQKAKHIEDELRKFAAGEIPLLLVTGLLDNLNVQIGHEEAARKAADFIELAGDRDRQILDLIESAPRNRTLEKRVREFLESDLQKRKDATSIKPFVNLSRQAVASFHHLLSHELPECQTMLNELLGELDAAIIERERKAAEKASIPAEDAIRHLMDKRDQARTEMEEIVREIEKLERDILRIDHLVLRARQRLARLVEQKVRIEFEQEDRVRLVSHATRAQATLEQFKAKVIERHIDRIESCVSESFKSLLRKDGLIESLHIDPKTFRIDLIGAKGKVVPPERLSAGERQLLAVATLWGLAKASNRQLPTVIDTPLGRLDSNHRSNIVSRYFPVASHQVILLSTDEEIAGQYFKDLAPHVGRTFELVFDEDRGATKVVPGYFAEERLHAH